MKIGYNSGLINKRKTTAFKGNVGEISYEYARVLNMDKFIERVGQVVKKGRIAKRNPIIKSLREKLHDSKDVFNKSKEEIIEVLKKKRIVISVFDRQEEDIQKAEQNMQNTPTLRILKQLYKELSHPKQKNEWELIGLRPKRVIVREGKELLPEKIWGGYVYVKDCKVNNVEANHLHMSKASAENAKIKGKTEIYGGGLISSETGSLTFSQKYGDTILKDVRVKKGVNKGYWKEKEIPFVYVRPNYGTMIRRRW